MTPTIERGMTLISNGLTSNNDQLVRDGVRILKQTGYESRGIFAHLVEAETEQQYQIAKRKLRTIQVGMKAGGKRR